MARYIDAQTFKENWVIASHNQDRSQMKNLLRGIANHNYKLVKYKGIVPYNTFRWTDSCLQDDHVPAYSLSKNHIVFDDLTTDAAICKYTAMGGKVVAFNFANAEKPGGGYLDGAINTQEEELCRQYPRLYTSLDHARCNGIYPFPLESVLITHNIERMRENRENGYAVISNPTISCGIITAAAPDMHRVKNKNKTFEDFDIGMNKLFHLIFTVPKCNKENYNVLVIGAFGCGSFAPKEQEKRIPYKISMATLMMQYVVKYRGLYDIISIAIPDKNGENYQIFQEVFKNIPGIVFT